MRCALPFLALILGVAAATAKANSNADSAATDGAKPHFKWSLAIGLEGYVSRYDEPSIKVGDEGKFLGLLLNGRIERTGWQVLGEVRYAEGEVDYHGSGNLAGIPAATLESRLMLGRIFYNHNDAWSLKTLMPYLGYGYRVHEEYGGGLRTSTNARGYDRTSTYHYLPIGLEATFDGQAEWSFRPRIEYDYFIRGSQESKLSQAISGVSDVRNKQSSGYGLRAEVMAIRDFGRAKLEFGPYFRYWDIQQSNTVPVTYLGTAIGNGYEPSNTTREMGLAVMVRF